jgi:hypothetical protein
MKPAGIGRRRTGASLGADRRRHATPIFSGSLQQVYANELTGMRLGAMYAAEKSIDPVPVLYIPAKRLNDRAASSAAKK